VRGHIAIIAVDRLEEPSAVSDQVVRELRRPFTGSMRTQTRLWQYCSVAAAPSAAQRCNWRHNSGRVRNPGVPACRSAANAADLLFSELTVKAGRCCDAWHVLGLARVRSQFSTWRIG
jgi:hypothetical protein